MKKPASRVVKAERAVLREAIRWNNWIDDCVGWGDYLRRIRALRTAVKELVKARRREEGKLQ